MSTKLYKNAKKSWTPRETLQLEEEHKNGCTLEQISKTHGRSVTAIINRLDKMGYKYTDMPAIAKPTAGSSMTKRIDELEGRLSSLSDEIKMVNKRLEKAEKRADLAQRNAKTIVNVLRRTKL